MARTRTKKSKISRPVAIVEDGQFYVAMAGNIVRMDKRIFFDEEKATQVLFMMAEALTDTIKSTNSDREIENAKHSMETLLVMPLRIM